MTVAATALMKDWDDVIAAKAAVAMATLCLETAQENYDYVKAVSERIHAETAEESEAGE